jgi:hypothetical protein
MQPHAGLCIVDPLSPLCVCPGRCEHGCVPTGDAGRVAGTCLHKLHPYPCIAPMYCIHVSHDLSPTSPLGHCVDCARAHVLLPRVLRQVVVSLAGNVTFERGVSMQCPTGTNFLDSFGGLYDRGAFPVQTTACSNSALYSLVLASSLQFVCAR